MYQPMPALVAPPTVTAVSSAPYSRPSGVGDLLHAGVVAVQRRLDLRLERVRARRAGTWRTGRR